MNKKEKTKVMQEMIDSRDNTSRTQKHKNKVFKEQVLMNTMFKEKREKRKKTNIQKFYKIKIKKEKA